MDLVDIKTESLIIGSLYNEPNLFYEYGDKINPSLDFNSDNTRFLYRLLFDCFFSQGKLNETAIKVFVDGKSSAYKKEFNEIGGVDTLDRMRNITVQSVSNFDVIYTKLKSYFVLRELQEKGVDITKHFNEFKDADPIWILENYEKMLNEISLHLKGVHNPKNLGDGTINFMEHLKENPDVGIPIHHTLLSKYLRGLRPKTVNCISAHTNRGKTRILTDILTHTSVLGENKALLISTEMTNEEMKLQFLTSVYNKRFAHLNRLDESSIATNSLTDDERLMVEKSAKYFEENSKVDFICINIYDFETLKRYIKQAHMNNVEIIAIDVLKPMRSGKTILQEWQQYPRTVEQLKDLMIELGMTLVFTAQLTTQSVNDKDLDINNIANGTQISHILDSLLIFRDIPLKELEQASYIPKGKKEEDALPFDTEKRYMVCKIAKNRGGMNGVEIAMEVDRGSVKFNELGRYVRTPSVI